MVKGKARNEILKAVGYTNLVLFLLAACAIDSESWTPLIVCVVTGTYLTLFTYVNNWFEEV